MHSCILGNIQYREVNSNFPGVSNREGTITMLLKLFLTLRKIHWTWTNKNVYLFDLVSQCRWKLRQGNSQFSDYLLNSNVKKYYKKYEQLRKFWERGYGDSKGRLIWFWWFGVLWRSLKTILFIFFQWRVAFQICSFTPTFKFFATSKAHMLIFPLPYTLLHSPISTLLLYSTNTRRLYHSSSPMNFHFIIIPFKWRF